jgi:triacylglycerol esterase/lipase EstA (alpha/beta hydrolase family)
MAGVLGLGGEDLEDLGHSEAVAVTSRQPVRALLLYMVLTALPSSLVAAPAEAAERGCQDPASHATAVPAGTTPVILVHGWTGQPAEMRSLGNTLKQRLGSRISVQYFDYSRDSARWAAQPAVASCLAHFVHDATDAHGTRAVLVSHSMGGLAIRFATSDRYTDRPIGRAQIARVITIDTPHRGSPFGGTRGAEVRQALNEHRPAATAHDVWPPTAHQCRCLRGVPCRPTCRQLT